MVEDKTKLLKLKKKKRKKKREKKSVEIEAYIKPSWVLASTNKKLNTTPPPLPLPPPHPVEGGFVGGVLGYIHNNIPYQNNVFADMSNLNIGIL
jgi:hypothetical protein